MAQWLLMNSACSSGETSAAVAVKEAINALSASLIKSSSNEIVPDISFPRWWSLYPPTVKQNHAVRWFQMHACIHTISYILLAVGTYTYTHHIHIGTCRCPRKRANSTLSLTMDRMVLIPATSSPLELSCTIISSTYATTYAHLIHFRYLTQQV